MKLMLKTILIIAALVVGFAPGAQAGEFSGYFSMDSTSGEPGDQISIAVYLHDNTVDFAALMLPIRYPSQHLKMDSVSFEGSLKPENFSAYPVDFPQRNLMQISYLTPFPVETISSSGGLVGTIHFTILDEALAGYFPIDSASIDSFAVIGLDTTKGWVGAMLSNGAGDTVYFPDCLGGGVNIKVPTSVPEDKNGLPASFALGQNYPNPFNPTTTITYSIASAGHVKLEVYNVLGQSAAVLVDGFRVAGDYQADFDARTYPSGVFFYRLTQADKSLTKKMVLVK